MNFTWILDDDGNPIPCDDPNAFEAFLADINRRHVGYDDIGEVNVSTVFLGVDHRHTMDGPPILFETMIFGGMHDHYQARYVTRAEAIEGHQRAVEMVWRTVETERAKR